MKRPWFSPSLFMIVFCCAYAFIFAMDWPLFNFYPLHGDFNWGPRLLKGAGPAIVWYGLMSGAGIVAFIAAISFPDRAILSLLRDYLWLFPCSAMLVCIYLLRHFFV